VQAVSIFQLNHICLLTNTADAKGIRFPKKGRAIRDIPHHPSQIATFPEQKNEKISTIFVYYFIRNTQ